MWGDENLFHEPWNQSSYRNSRLWSIQLETDMKQFCCWYPLFICDHINLNFAHQRVMPFSNYPSTAGVQKNNVHMCTIISHQDKFIISCNSIVSKGIMPESNFNNLKSHTSCLSISLGSLENHTVAIANTRIPFHITLRSHLHYEPKGKTRSVFTKLLHHQEITPAKEIFLFIFHPPDTSQAIDEGQN